MTKSNTVSAIVIPARLASTRLPHKLLLNSTGKPLLQHTYESASTSLKADSVCVATEDEEIATAVRQFGGTAVMTSVGLQNGTLRLAEVAKNSLTDVDILVNVQGDEPQIDGATIDRLITTLEDNPQTQMATLAAPIRSAQELHDPSCVKVVMDHHGQAIYFSRSPVPYPRAGVREEMFADPPSFHQHIGVYAYRRELLLQLDQLPVSPLAELESLEQLAAVQAGVSISVNVLDKATCGIDTPADYDRFVQEICGRTAQGAA